MNLNILQSLKLGWKNYIFKTPIIEEMAHVRAEICSECPFANPKFLFKLWIPEKEELKFIEGLGCDVCHCPLSSKLRSPLEKCPKDKW